MVKAERSFYGCSLVFCLCKVEERRVVPLNLKKTDVSHLDVGAFLVCASILRFPPGRHRLILFFLPPFLRVTTVFQVMKFFLDGLPETCCCAAEWLFINRMHHSEFDVPEVPQVVPFQEVK